MSQERLAFHLTLACAIYAAIVWTARQLAPRRARNAGAAAAGRRRDDVLGAVANLSRRAGRRQRGRARLQHLAAIDGAFVPRRAASLHQPGVAKPVREHADRSSSITACSPTRSGSIAMLHAIDAWRSGARRRRADAGGPGHRAGGARHRDAALPATARARVDHQIFAIVVFTAAIVHAERLWHGARRAHGSHGRGGAACMIESAID